MIIRFKSFITILFVLILTNNGATYAQNTNDQTSAPLAEPQLILFVDNEEKALPDDIYPFLKQVPHTEWDDAIITFLSNVDSYESIKVKILSDKKSKNIVYYVEASSLKRIQDVIFDGISTRQNVFLTKNLNLQSGKNFSRALITEDKEKIIKNLQEKGFLEAQITNYDVELLKNGFVNLIYHIDTGHTCQIDQVNIENSRTNLLNFINLPIETGTPCDLPSIRDKLSQIKNNYISQGYLEAIVKIKNIAYSEKKDHAKLTLIIEKGPKTIVQIQNEDYQITESDLLNSNDRPFSYSDLMTLSNNDLINRVSTFYKNKGYPYVSVTALEKSKDDYDNILYTFNVNKGKFYEIGDVFFTRELPEDKASIIEALGLKRGFFSNKIPFVQDNLSTYRDTLKSIFFKHGYADAQVQIPDFTFSPNSNQVNLVFDTLKGDKYLLSTISIKNLPEDVTLDQKTLNDILKKGDTVNFEKRQSYLNELRKELLDNGYLYSQIEFSQSFENTEQEIKFVNMNFNMTPGEKVRIRKIYIQGDTFNKDKSIISVSGLKEGMIYNQYNIELARNKILHHNLFSSVNIEPLNPYALEDKEPNLDLLIRVRGKNGFLFSFSPGYGTLRGYRFTTDYSLYGLTQDGLTLVSSAGLSQEKQQSNFNVNDTRQILGQQVNLGFSEPLFKVGPLRTPIDMNAIAGYQVVAETLTNRRYETLKFSGVWKPYLFDYPLELTSSLLHEKSKSTSSENAIVQTIDSPDLIIREWENSISLDSRDNQAWPTKGGIFSFKLGLARFGIGSDVQFNRYTPKMNLFFPLYKSLSAGFFAGASFTSNTLNNFGGTVTPPASRRSTLTDDALIRGFPDTFGSAAPGPLLWIYYNPNSLSQNCSTQLASVGGTNLIYMKAEARYRINDIFGIVLFTDTGESFFSESEVSQINALIQTQIQSATLVKGQCTVQDARLVAPDTPHFTAKNFVGEYWKNAYVSSGIGLRFILGSVASLSLDYGYPLKDPASHFGKCVSTSEALSSTSAPDCVNRIQSSSYNIFGYKFNYKGAINFGIGAQF